MRSSVMYVTAKTFAKSHHTPDPHPNIPRSTHQTNYHDIQNVSCRKNGEVLVFSA